jgi:hypothetical protein
MPPKSVNMQVTGENINQAAGLWQGGQGTKTETSLCPNCGSDLFFSRSNSGSVISQNGMATPAPRCYSCGYTVGREMQGIPPTS